MQKKNEGISEIVLRYPPLTMLCPYADQEYIKNDQFRGHTADKTPNTTQKTKTDAFMNCAG